MDYLRRIVGDSRIEDFVGRKLPSIIEVMSVLFYHRKDLKLQQRESVSITIEKLQAKWTQAGIPTCGRKYATKKLTNLLNEAKNLKKSAKRRWSNAQQQKQSNFEQKMKNLFDIAKLNVDKYINNDQKLFLAGQRSKSRFGLIDNTLKSEEIDKETMIVDSAGRCIIFHKTISI